MLQIAICDDKLEDLEKIQISATLYFKNLNKQVPQITCFDNPLRFLDYIDKNGGFDIVLLDICMPGLNGTVVAKSIRDRKNKTEIIFLSSSDEFAVIAFSLKAAHYLLKPFTQQQFDEAMNRALTAFSNEDLLRLPLRLSGGGVHTVDLNEILYVESFNHEQQVHLKDGDSLTIRESLSKLLAQIEELSPGQFLSPYKGYLINLKAVRSVEPNCVKLYGGKTIPIARRSFRSLSDRCFAFAFTKDNQRGIPL